MKRAALLLIVAVAAVAGLPADARACSIAGPVEHVVDPSMQATDQTPPTLPPNIETTIKRGMGPQQQGCGQGSSSCDDLGVITIAARATDDVTPPTRIGYRLTLAAGSPPAGLQLPAYPVEFAGGGGVALAWRDGATDDQEAIDFTLKIVAIDLAGNESAAQTVRVSDDSGHACAVARRAAHWQGLAGVTVGAILLMARKRSRRRTP
jgi:hypothetical protein